MHRRSIIKEAKKFHEGYCRTYNTSMQYINRSIKESNNSISCKKGCHYCCYQITAGSIVTGVLIYERIKDNTGLLDSVLRQGDLQDKFILKHRSNSGNRYVTEQHHPCALLDENGHCRVYDIRPPACSAYMVVSEPERCNTLLAGRLVSIVNAEILTEFALINDGIFLNRVIPTWSRERALAGTLGTMVKLGSQLLENPYEFEKTVENTEALLHGVSKFLNKND